MLTYDEMVKLFKQEGIILTYDLRLYLEGHDSQLTSMVWRGLVPSDDYWKKLLQPWQTPENKRFSLADCEKEHSLAALVDALDQGKHCLILGPYGNGKTCLCRALAVKRIAAGKKLAMTTWTALLDLLSQAAGYSAAARAMLDIYKTIDCLIIDDLGRTSITTDNRYTGLVDLIGTRYEAGRQILITSNLTQSELETNISPQLVSRLLEDAVIVLMKQKMFRKPLAVIEI
ncbi:MAG: ATP-binding protein [Planctomycetota bacterium]